MHFNNSQSGYQNFVPVYGNATAAATSPPYYYQQQQQQQQQQPEDPAVATDLIASNIPEDSLLYDVYDYNHAVTNDTSGIAVYPSQPASPPMSPAITSPRGQEEDTAAITADRKRPKRKQVKNACVNCQKACKKCDDGRPCQRCIKLGLTATCTNSPRKERKKGVKRGPYKKRLHLDGVHDNSSKFSDWEDGSCSEFAPYGTMATTASEVPSMLYQSPNHHHQVLSNQVASLPGSSPLSSDASFSYLPYGDGGLSVTTTTGAAAGDASSASGASLSPVSPDFPSNTWEEYSQYPYSAAVQQSVTAPIDAYPFYPPSSTAAVVNGYDNVSYQPYSLQQPVYTSTGTITSATAPRPEEEEQQQEGYLYPPQTTQAVVAPSTVPSTSSWTPYSSYFKQQQPVVLEQQEPSTGYWQMFLAA